jgi:glycogen synthase
MAPMRAETNVRRVLMTADCVGGVWTYAMDLGAGLTRSGLDVTVAVMGPCLPDGHRADAASRGIEVVEGPFALEWMDGPWDDVDRAGEWLLSLEKLYTPDVVHLNGFCHAALPWAAPVLVVGHSCVRTWWRGVHADTAPPSWDAYTERVSAGLLAANLVVTPTRALLDELREEYGDIRMTRVIPNGSSAVHRPPSTTSKEPLVFSAGRLWDEAKNVTSVSAAANDITWRTCIAGEARGPSGMSFASGAACYLGRLSGAQMADWYRRASIYVLPARYEPFGLSIVEAAAAGCALVLGDIRTLRENWTGAAAFVPPDNRRALARTIQSLIDDGLRREQLGRAARERAKQFTVDAMTSAYLDAYEGLVARKVAA